MSDRRGVNKQASSDRIRIKLDPMARAIRSVLAVSTIALTLGTAGNAIASTPCDVPAGSILQCAASAIDTAPVVDLTVVEDAGLPAAATLAVTPLSIVGYGPGDVVIENSDPINEIGAYYATAIAGYSPDGDVDITNHEGADLLAGSPYGPAIGIAGYAGAGDVSVDNAASVVAVSLYGIAEGIFAAGQNVDVSNSGLIETYSYGWSAGIEAESSDSTTVTNSGDIVASAGEAWLTYDSLGYVLGLSQGGQAKGIYATGGEGGIEVGNSGSIYVSGGYVAGIDVQSSGDIVVDNSGDISNGPAAGRTVDAYGNTTLYGAQLAYGIDVASTGDGTAIHVSNSGNIDLDSMYGASGIAATASGYGSTVDVSNTGDIHASQYLMYGYQTYGIVASADGDARVDNAGSITLDSAGAATGASSMSFAGDAQLVNSGDIVVNSAATREFVANGAVSFSGNGHASVDNSGTIEVVTGYVGRAIDVQGYAGAEVTNSGSVSVDALLGYGIYAMSFGGAASVTNEAGGEIGFNSYMGNGIGMFAGALGGDAVLVNDGTIQGQGALQAIGMFGQSWEDTSLTNTGSIEVSAIGDAAVGMFATADYGTASIVNSGDISATTVDRNGYNYLGYTAYGALARGAEASISNSGNIHTYADVYSTGLGAQATGDVSLVSSGGDISSYAYGAVLLKSFQGYYYTYYYYAIGGAASGIHALSTAGDVEVSNASDITAISYLADATGIKVKAGVDATVTNTGDILAGTIYGFADGILVQDNYVFGQAPQDGHLSVVNSGDIQVVALAQGVAHASGITASRYQGSIDIQNSGAIDVYAGGRSYAIAGSVMHGQVAITNSGDITMFSPTDAQIGIQASTGSFFTGGGDVSVVNSGHISIHSDYGFANAIGAVAGSVQDPHGNSYIRNSGDIDVLGMFNAAAIQTRASQGDATVINSGDINIQTRAVGYAYLPDQTVGVAALTFFGGDLTIQNSGDVDVLGYAHAYGLYVKSSNDGTMTISNAGDVYVHSELSQFGDNGPYGYPLPGIVARAAYAYGYSGDVIVNNTGSLVASGGDAAIGVHAMTVGGSIVVTNAGDIHAGDSGQVIGVLLGNYVLQPYGAEDWTPGTSTLNNSGAISVDGDGDIALAVFGGWAADTINNSGTITGAISLYAADDTFNNQQGGLLDLTGRTLDMGDGNDTVANAAGGTLLLDGGTIAMGAGNNAFSNSGLIVVNGDGLIDMGGDAPASAAVAGFASGLFQAMAVSAPIRVAAALDSGPLVNNGTIRMADGSTDDTLTVVGDLSGTGSVDIDASLEDASADQLHVEGDVLAGTAQTVNVAFTGVPSADAVAFEFATIDGSAATGAFVGGEATGLSRSDFLDLDVVISSQSGSGGGTVFLAGIGVAGLNDTGTLAAGIAPGAATFINSQVGTFRQRLGVNPYGGDGKVLSAFFRAYRDEGDVTPAHTAGNFGDGGNFDFNQKSSGEEVGINANVFGNFHAGIVLGNAETRQRLLEGEGQVRMDGMTVGGYATWYVVDGFYLDLSGRKMTADVELKSGGSVMGTRVDISAASLEAGYQWKLGERFVLVPQLQYTRGKVGGVRALSGETLDFQPEGGTFARGRIGVEANFAFQAGAARLTPYGSINAVRIFDGESTYTVADSYHGSTSITGSSAMAELGLGVENGGFGFSIGANWTDGGALDGFFGGQANVRYAW